MYTYTQYIGRGSCLIFIGTFFCRLESLSSKWRGCPAADLAGVALFKDQPQPGSEWGEKGITYVNQPLLGINLRVYG